MKKVILLIAVMFCFVSCEMDFMYEPTTDKHGVTRQQVSSVGDFGVEKITVEGHEYLMFTYYCISGTTSISVVHSATCPANHDKNGFGTDVDSIGMEEK